VTALEARARESLLARRERLVELAATRGERRLVELLQRVDAALGALEVGTWGLCAVCHEPMDPARLEADPLVRVCLECLPEDERRALERDLEAAARTQRALLPAARTLRDGWEIAYLWEPHGAVSGDHVDLFGASRPGEPLYLLLGDVSGKGLGASLLQAHLNALFRALAASDPPLDELVGRANRLFADATTASRYATLVALRLDAEGGVELANAGHPRPLLADARGVRPIEGGGLPLGLVCDTTFPAHRLELQEGETLLLYTDGWTEAERDDEEFGIGRAAAALRRAAARPLDELLAACRDEADAFLAGARRGDDRTLVAVRRRN